MIKTDRVELISLECGETHGRVNFLEEGCEGVKHLPAYSFLVRHPSSGMVLFDAGLPPSMHGVKVMGLFDVDVPEGQGLTVQLAKQVVDALHVERIIMSHAHFDHIAGAELVPNAKILIARNECDAMADEASAFQLGHNRQLIDGRAQPNAFDKAAYFSSLRMQSDGSFIVPSQDSSFLEQMPYVSNIIRPKNSYWSNP